MVFISMNLVFKLFLPKQVKLLQRVREKKISFIIQILGIQLPNLNRISGALLKHMLMLLLLLLQIGRAHV